MENNKGPFNGPFNPINEQFLFGIALPLYMVYKRRIKQLKETEDRVQKMLELPTVERSEE